VCCPIYLVAIPYSSYSFGTYSHHKEAANYWQAPKILGARASRPHRHGSAGVLACGKQRTAERSLYGAM